MIEEDASLMPGREVVMKTTRVFKSGNSQAVRLPKEFSVKSKIVEILRRGDEIVLREPGKGLGRAFEVLPNFLMISLLKDVRTHHSSSGRDCDSGSFSIRYQYLHLHPTPKTGERFDAFPKT